MKRKNIIAGVVLLLIGLAYGWLALQLPDRAQTGALSPGFFPLIIAALLTIFSASLLVQGLVMPAPSEKAQKPEGFNQAALALFAFFVYIAALRFFGFVITSIPFFAVMMVLFGERRIVWLVSASVGVTLFLYAVFEQGLYLHALFGEDWRFIIPLPRAELEF